ncbi:murein biosynthesis integral membrane protein MurJ [Peptoniphilus sp. KCTC 25270]|uniref:murein biosynthesis integral membrane protein MurJ n=1 Tax=Peptoniphilus sp. KCTC 25270 TaxID=2897414 RepID=UPI001E515B58|nr:murein biosynthesis integral membrane protein MurJ [Peptoniphilus sp. KCTC 25270]MCD1147247.1 murein biosynthesis integral membrane protein MurJ [Peptoniphilus sp. KCTC 25270]
MGNTSILLMVATILTKCFGLAREKALAHFFGTSEIANIFLVALSLPLLFTNLFTGSIAGGFIPIYNELENKEGTEKANLFTADLVNIVAVIVAGLAALAFLFAPLLVRLQSPGFTGEIFSTTVFMTRITMISVMVTGVAAIFRAYLQIKGVFIVSTSHSVIMNLILIVTMFLGQGENIPVLAFGILCSFVFQYILFVPFLKKKGYRHRFQWDWHDPALRKLLLLIVPVLLSASAIELNTFIARALASSISQEGISVVNYASKIQGFINGIVVTSIVTVTFPQMSRFVESGEEGTLAKVFGESLSLMAFLVIPATFGMVAFSDDIVRLLFLGGAFKEQDVIQTGQVLIFYCIGLLAIGIREIGIRIFYSRKEMKIPIVNSFVILGSNFILSFLLSRRFGLAGLGMGASASLVIGAVFILISLRGVMPRLGIREKLGNFFKIILAAVVMIVVAKTANGILLGMVSKNLALLLSIGAAGVVYFLGILFLRVDEIHEIKRIIKRV